MGDKSKIEWTDATWNPVTGCSKVSPGCAHCYAEELSLRRGWSAYPWTPEHAAANVVLHPERLELPLHWRTPRRIFVNSMSDLFHEQVPDEYIDEVLLIMAVQARHHTYQILTKRPERMRDYFHNLAARANGFNTATILCLTRGQDGQYEWQPERYPHIRLGTSVENQHWADVRIPLLLQTPAAVRFLSCEPLLGEVSLERWLAYHDSNGEPTFPRRDSGLHWVIVGGESGPAHRPMNPTWARMLRDECEAADVAFLFKQWGGRTPKAGGRLLDGREYNEYPQEVAA